jgi:hypothetical protein
MSPGNVAVKLAMLASTGLGAILVALMFWINDCRHRNADYEVNPLYYVPASFLYALFFIYIALVTGNMAFALLGAGLLALAATVSIYYVVKKCDISS